MRVFYQSLRPVTAVTALVDRLTRDFTARVIGVHCRQTDNDRSFYEGRIPTSAYHAEIDLALDRWSDATIFVAADTRGAREETRRRYGRRVLPHPFDEPGADPALMDRYAMRGQQAALAEMIALSRTSFLVGTRFSSFTYCAAVLGDVAFVETGRHLTPDPLT
jgi:hypothetical protein